MERAVPRGNFGALTLEGSELQGGVLCGCPGAQSNKI